MQVVIVVAGSAVDSIGVAQRLTREICGVPLLARTLATAERAGATFQMIDSDHSPFYSARTDLIQILLDHG